MKKSKSSKLGTISHFDLYGKRDKKYSFLNENSISSISWNNLEKRKPNFFFVNKDYEIESKYNKGINVSELFNLFSLKKRT